MSWFRCEADAHERRRLFIRSMCVPLDRDTAVDDLRVYQDRVLHAIEKGLRYDELSSSDFAERWGWSKSKAYRLVSNHAAWSDPSRLESWTALWHDHDTSMERGRNEDDTNRNGQTVTLPETRNDGDTTVERERNEIGHRRVEVTPPSPSPQKNTTPAPPVALGLTPDEPTTLDTSPPWARKAKRPGVTAQDIAEHVLRALGAIRAEPANPARCATSAGEVLGLWKAEGYPPIATLADELCLVARWAQTSSDPLAENDIRGTRRDGQRWGTDRSRNVETLCVHSTFESRLAAAKRWAGHAARDDVVALQQQRTRAVAIPAVTIRPPPSRQESP